ncbi:MAG TPA: nucleotidyltransferase domain-containing protein [Actinomycetota bacterium]|nr:nucleotidyltransferase domain-containing protein [Actinomycetota bacterium]
MRSLRSSVLRWPGREEVDRAVRAWAAETAARHPRVVRVGYFGSYARGDWGVGSDVDVVVLLSESDEPFPRRAAAFDATELPVPADVFAYTVEEWEALARRGGLARTVEREVVWVHP